VFGLSLETCVSNLKSVAFTVLELLAFDAPTIDWPIRCAQTDARRHNRMKTSPPIHFVHLMEIINT